ncbi:MAG: aldo/keto reductase [Candidatus Hodarchaeales archaeon]
MKYTTLGNTDLKISSIGLGTWQLGNRAWNYGEGDFNKKQALKLMNEALEHGINIFDTAEVYGNGKSEKIIGEFLNEHRNEVIIATKFMPATVIPSKVKKAVANSLRRLGIKTIDLYQIHWPNPVLPLGKTLRHMEDLVNQGKIRYIGVSNYSTKRLKNARSKMKKYDIVSNQVNYSLIKRGPENSLIDYARKEKITIIAYSPLAQGFLTGKYSTNNPPPKGIRGMNLIFSKGNLKRAEHLLNLLRIIANKHEATPAQVALSYLIRDDRVVAIPGAKNLEQVRGNTRATDIILSEMDVKQIVDVFSKFKKCKVRSLPYLLKNLLTAR